MKIEQRIGRLSRIGQTHDVHVFNLVAADTVEAAVLHLLEAKLNMFELVIGEVDMILGNLDDEREFPDVVADLWAESADQDDFARRIDELGDRLLEAKRAYFEQRAIDDKLFGNRFAPRRSGFPARRRQCRRAGSPTTSFAPRPMSTDLDSPGSAPSPLEAFLRDYAETTGGLWDEVEPQVYDLMLPGREHGGGRAGDGALGVRPRGDPGASRRATGQLRDAADRSPAGRRREPGPAPRAVPGRAERVAAGRGGPAAPGGHAAVGVCPEGRAARGRCTSPRRSSGSRRRSSATRRSRTC